MSLNPRKLSKAELYDKYIKEGYYHEWAIVKSENEFNERLIHIPSTKLNKVPNNYDMGTLD